MSLVRQGCAWQFEVMLWLLSSREDSVVHSGELCRSQEILMVWKPSPVMEGQCDRWVVLSPCVLEAGDRGPQGGTGWWGAAGAGRG